MKMNASATAALAEQLRAQNEADRGGWTLLEPRLRALEELLARQLQATEALTEAVQRLVLGPTDDRNSRYDAQTVEVMRRVLGPADNGIDVGAHVGDVLRHMVELAPEGRHLAFEPLPHLAEGLREAFPSVTVHQVALSDADGQATFHHVTTNPAYSGLLLRRLDRPDEQVETIDVPVRVLDDLVDASTPVRFLKVDVEGAELGVLRGARQLLARDRPYVVFEHGLGAADVYGTSPTDVLDVLSGADLQVFLLQDWLAGVGPLDTDRFVQQFETNENYYFLAAPA